MRNVILGGDGLLGTALQRVLASRGESAVSYDLKSGFDLREKDPPRDDDAFYWFFAWDVGGAKYIMDPQAQIQIMQSNVRLCDRVFGWLSDRKTPFLFVSTQMAGYPNAYGLTKAIGEYWAQSAGGLVCRLWNIYDAEPVCLKSHVTADLVSQGIKGKIQLLTSGSERRQLLHAEDCAAALLHQRSTGQKLADITSGEWIPIRKVAETVARLTNADLVLGPKDGYESIIEPTYTLAGWAPKIGLETGLTRVIERMKAEGWY
jgi:nucleoside-diphosphate-sugar epimerase